MGDKFRHDGGFYASDDEFAALVVPFAEAGLDAGDAVVFGYDDRKQALLRAWLPDDDAITYVAAQGAYARPARALAGWASIAKGQLARGHQRVRVAGDVPHAGASFAGWDRYEAAIDRVCSPLPVWARCLYDARIASTEVVDCVTRLHRHLLEPADAAKTSGDGDHARHGAVGDRDNPRYRALSSLAECVPAQLEDMERTPPAVELRDPTPAGAREIVGALAQRRVGPSLVDDLRLATSEIVTNALRHGRAPVCVAMWAEPGKVSVHVRDRGTGPSDALVGLIEPDEVAVGSARGLWITHQLDLDVGFIFHDDGFTVRLFVSEQA